MTVDCRAYQCSSDRARQMPEPRRPRGQSTAASRARPYASPRSREKEYPPGGAPQSTIGRCAPLGLRPVAALESSRSAPSARQSPTKLKITLPLRRLICGPLTASFLLRCDSPEAGHPDLFESGLFQWCRSGCAPPAGRWNSSPDESHPSRDCRDEPCTFAF